MNIKNEPLLILQKNADKEKNRVIIPSSFIKENGYQFYMKVYKDKIELIPIKQKEKKENCKIKKKQQVSVYKKYLF